MGLTTVALATTTIATAVWASDLMQQGYNQFGKIYRRHLLTILGLALAL
jgi:hypothetical protein